MNNTGKLWSLFIKLVDGPGKSDNLGKFLITYCSSGDANLSLWKIHTLFKLSGSFLYIKKLERKIERKKCNSHFFVTVIRIGPQTGVFWLPNQQATIKCAQFTSYKSLWLSASWRSKWFRNNDQECAIKNKKKKQKEIEGHARRPFTFTSHLMTGSSLSILNAKSSTMGRVKSNRIIFLVKAFFL